MITNYLTAAIRRLLKNKVFSLINILGLTIGMTAFIFIFQYIKYEESYDRFRANSDNLYRLFTRTYESGQLTWEGLWCCFAIGPSMKEDIPEVLDYARLLPLALNVITYENTKVTEPMYYAVDGSFLTMFSVPMLKGNAENALKEPNAVVISKSAAEKYFGSEDPMGKVLAISNNYGKILYTVTGIFKDVPPNSHLKFNILVSMLKGRHGHPWNDTNYLVYLLLKPGSDPKTVEAKLPAFLDKYLADVFKKNNRRDIITLQAVKDIHLSAGILDDFFQYVKKGNAETIGYLRIISFLVLLIAWINYINLSIAYSMARGREIGIRKVVGAARSQIMMQSVMETIAITVLGFLGAILIVFLLLPLFPRFTGIPVLKEMWLDPVSWLVVFFIFITAAILSALFPAQFLASLKPNMLLKGNFVNSKTGTALRKIFTIFQFTASIVLIACTLTIYMQNKFIDSFDGGYVKENILMANQPTLYLQHPETISSFKTEISQYAEFGDITAACFVPGMGNPATVSVRRMSDTNTKLSTLNFVDYNFLNLFQIKLAAGRNFSEDYSTDENAIIINEAAVKFLNFENPGKAINQSIIARGPKKIIGVVKDYNQANLKSPVLPLILMLEKNAYPYFIFKLNTKNYHNVLSLLKTTWEKYFPLNPFDYMFMDEKIDSVYLKERQLGLVFGFFAFLSIFISCLGLLALVYMSIIQRRKEIGIRMVLGARIANILFLLSKNFRSLLVIAMLIAYPVAYFAMSKWLQDFAFRVHIQLYWFIGIPFVVSMAIVVILISSLSIKIIKSNPIESIRDE